MSDRLRSICTFTLALAERHAARYRNAAGEVGPDFIVGAHQLERWWLIPRNCWFNIYLHRFNHSDEDRALHDHMYVNASWVLGPGGYWEVVPVDRHAWLKGRSKMTIALWRRAGRIVVRRPATPHRIVLPTNNSVWSLFVTGPRVRQWGFWCPQGWRHWAEFSDPLNKGQVGRGCE